MAITIALDEKTAEVAEQLAANEKRTANDVIRDALAAYANSGRRPLPAGMGKYHSGRSDTSANARQILRHAVEEREWP